MNKKKKLADRFDDEMRVPGFRKKNPKDER